MSKSYPPLWTLKQCCFDPQWWGSVCLSGFCPCIAAGQIAGGFDENDNIPVSGFWPGCLVDCCVRVVLSESGGPLCIALYNGFFVNPAVEKKFGYERNPGTCCGINCPCSGNFASCLAHTFCAGCAMTQLKEMTVFRVAVSVGAKVNMQSETDKLVAPSSIRMENRGA